MSPAAFAADFLDRGLELLIVNGRLRVWPAKAYHRLTADERSCISHFRAELKALVRAGLTTLPDGFTPEMKTAAIARLRSYDQAAADTSDTTATSQPERSERSERRVSWDERAQNFVPDHGITI